MLFEYFKTGPAVQTKTRAMILEMVGLGIMFPRLTVQITHAKEAALLGAV